MSGSNVFPSGRDGGPEALEVLLELSLRGDREALETLLTILQTRHYRRILGNLRRFQSRARTQTLEDVFQDSILELYERIRSGGLEDLPPEARRDVLGYFQRICDRRLRNMLKPRKSALHQRGKPEIPPTLMDSKAAIPGLERKTEEHRRLLQSAILRLDPLARQVLQRHLDGVPYRQIAKDTGKSENALQFMVWHAKRSLLMDILPRSPTAKLHYERERARERSPLTAEEVRRAVDRLPVETRDAVLHVHYEGGSVDSLARRLGDQGYRKAEARLRKGYEILSARLSGHPFPESFQGLEGR